jgi:putative FmdB family regulatory protein
MPIYEYECGSCHHQFEFLVLPSTVPACPGCGGTELTRLLSGFAVSSDSIRRSHLAAAKRRFASSADVKDKSVAEARYAHEHTFEDVDPKFRPPVPTPKPST